MPKRGPLRTSKAFRRKRLEKCIHYLTLSGNLPAARKRALLTEGFVAQTSCWITALGQILKDHTVKARVEKGETQ